MEDGQAAWRRGDFARAYELSRLRLPRQADADGPYRSSLAPLEDAHALHEHGRVCWQTARFAEAREVLERALDLRERSLGPEHVATLATLERLAALASYTGDEALATSRFETVLARLARGGDEARLPRAIARRNFAAHLRDGGPLERARAELDEARRELVALLPVEHPDRIDALKVLAMLELAEGDPEEALETVEEAIELGTRTWGSAHPFVAAAHLTAARCELRLAEHARSRHRLQRALAVLSASYGSHPLVALALQVRARLELLAASWTRGLATAREASLMFARFYGGAILAGFQLTELEMLVETDELAEGVRLAETVVPHLPEEVRSGWARYVATALLADEQIAEGVRWLERALVDATDGRREIEEALRQWRAHLATPG